MHVAAEGCAVRSIGLFPPVDRLLPAVSARSLEALNLADSLQQAGLTEGKNTADTVSAFGPYEFVVTLELDND